MKTFMEFESRAAAETHLIRQGWKVKKGDTWEHWNRPKETRTVKKVKGNLWKFVL